MTAPRSAGPSERDRRLLEVGLVKGLNLELVGRADGEARARFALTEPVGEFGTISGGGLYTALDACALLALTPVLGRTEVALTHDMHISVLRQPTPAIPVSVVSRITRRAKRLVFLEAHARQGDRLIASASFTKSIAAAG